MDEILVDARIDKLIDIFNNKIEDTDVTQASLSEKLGIHKNSINLYLNKNRRMPLSIAIGLAVLLEIDITIACGIKTNATATHKKTDNKVIELTLSESEVMLLMELRKIKSNEIKETAIKNLTALLGLINM